MSDSETTTRALEQAARLRAEVAELHRTEPHPQLNDERLRAHLAVHELVELQLASGDPPQARAALERLLAAGLTRHQALHAIGAAVTREAAGMLHTGRELDRAAYLKALDSLGPASVPGK